jgi:hypothetical protein
MFPAKDAIQASRTLVPIEESTSALGGVSVRATAVFDMILFSHGLRRAATNHGVAGDQAKPWRVA